MEIAIMIQQKGVLHIVVLWLVSSVHYSKGEGDSKSIRIDGHIILGGLFPMHEKGTGGNICGAIKEEKGIQRVEAMLFAIREINSDPEILPDITLGAHILDTCLRDTFALEQSLEFIKAHMSTLDVTEYTCSNGDKPDFKPKKPVAGVIGAAASPVSIMVANILRLFEIPQISYASTGIELSDKTRFGYFSRVVPPDNFQAQAMVDVVKSFGWRYVSTVADEGNYGEKGISHFEELATQNEICTATSLKIPREVKKDTFTNIIKALLQDSAAKVVVMFVNEDNCEKLVHASIRMGVQNDIYFLASDSWGAKNTPVVGQEAAAEGTVTILPQKKVLKEFDEYFKNLKLDSHKEINPWFEEYWESHFHCSLPENIRGGRIGRVCTGAETLKHSPKFTQEGIVPFVVDAVYAMAHALHKYIEDTCRTMRIKKCLKVKPINGTILLDIIRKVSFIGPANNEVKFNEVGDAMGRYTVYQYQKVTNNSYDYVPIGNWAESLDLDMTKVRWKHGYKDIPRSVCSEPCAPGEVKQAYGLNSECCWVCHKCNEFEILVNGTECIECGNGSVPNDNKTTCHDLPVQYISILSPWAYVPMIFSLIGIIAVVFVIVVFIKFNETPAIMASGRELCYVILGGLIMCYLMTYIMVAKPHFITCGLMRLLLGFSLSLCYAALLTKTNRISRIFNRGVKAMVKRPSYTSPRSQLVICFTMVSVQMVGAIAWIILDLPQTVTVYPDKFTVVLRCNTSNFAIVLSLLYNMILIIMCTFYALKTRKIPENFNEAKYIAFTMYSTCIVWLAFIPIYFGTHKSDFRIHITALCMCVSISATVALGCLFVPKIYLVLFQPHKNVRQGSKSGPGSGSGRPFFGRKQGAFSSLTAMNGDLTSPSNSACAPCTTREAVDTSCSLSNMSSPRMPSKISHNHSDLDVISDDEMNLDVDVDSDQSHSL